MIEKWLPVVGYEGYYEISDLGRLKSVERYVPHRTCKMKRVKEKMLPLSNDNYGYPIKTLFKNGKGKCFTIHKLVMMAFVGDSNGLTINHINGIKTDNRLVNLEYCTMHENILHAHKIGLRNLSHENNPNSKLNLFHVQRIKHLKNTGTRTIDIVREYGISKTQFYRIINNQSWQIKKTA